MFEYRVASFTIELITGNLISGIYNNVTRCLKINELIRKTSEKIQKNINFNDETTDQLAQLFSTKNIRLISQKIKKREAKNFRESIEKIISEIINKNEPNIKYQRDLSGFINTFIEVIINGLDKIDSSFANRILLADLDMSIDENRKTLTKIWDEVCHRIYNLENQVEQLKHDLKIYDEPFKKLVDDNCFLTFEKVQEERQRFWYRNNTDIFTGRTDELGELMEFCKSKEKIAWWAITGDGGAGKSHLAYEFIKRNCDYIEWTMEFLSWELIDKNERIKQSRCEYDTNLLLVFDYIVGHEKELADWITHLTKKREFKIRILILQREGEHKTDQKYIDKNPYWLNKMIKSVNSASELTARLYSTMLLKLPKMDKRIIISIMRKYIFKLKKDNRIIEEFNNESFILYRKINNIDPFKTRPLFALFVVDAWVEKRKAFEWDKSELLLYLNNHEKKYLRQFFNNDLEAYDSYIELLAYACATGKIDFTEMKRTSIRATSILEDYVRKNGITFVDVFEALGYYRYEDDTVYITAILPDMLAEYFVLEFLHEKIQRFQSEYVQKFIKNCWEYNRSEYTDFATRVVQDFHDHYLVSAKWLLKKNPNIENAFFEQMADVLVDLTLNDNLQISSEVVPKLSLMKTEFSSREITISYIISLVNIIYVQEPSDGEISVAKIRTMAEKMDELEIWIYYAKGLLNLVDNQTSEQAEIAVNQLEILAKEKKDIQLWIIFSSALVILADLQRGTERENTLKRLKELGVKKNDERIWVEVASSFVNIAYDEEIEEIEEVIKAVNKLEVLAEIIEQKKVWIYYANGMQNLIYSLGGKEAEKTLSRLESYAMNKDIIEIWRAFAAGILNYSAKQSIGVVTRLVSKLKKFAEEKNDSEIWESYAKSIVNLIYLQGPNENKATINELEKLAEQRNDIEIWITLAMGYMDWIDSQEADEGLSTLGKLKDLAEKFDNIEIWIHYVDAIQSLVGKIHATKGSELVKRIEVIAKEMKNREIWISYGNSLSNLIGNQTPLEGAEILSKLGKLAEKENSIEMWRVLANGYVNLSFCQNGIEGEKTIDKLRNLAKVKNDIEVWRALGNGLENLAENQVGKRKECTIRELETLAKEREDDELWAIYNRNHH